MYRRVLAFDFDGTLAVNGDVSPEVETALEQCCASGHVLFLVTGRRFESVPLGHPDLGADASARDFRHVAQPSLDRVDRGVTMGS